MVSRIYNMENHEDMNVSAEGNIESVDKNVERLESFDSDAEYVANVKDVSKKHIQIHIEGLQSTVWPDNVELYQPVESEQILFSEMPNCLYVQAFLRMCNLQYTLVQKTNAEYIGPSREVPVLRCGTFVVSGAEEIIKFVEAKGISLTSSFKESQKCEISCYISLVRMILTNAELFTTWLDPESYSTVTKPRFCSIHPWPLGPYMMTQQKKKILRKLDAMGWGHQTIEGIYEEMNLCFKALSDKLEGSFFFGNQPTQIDALVFAHIYTIMTVPLSKSQFAKLILGYPKLVEHCYRVLDYFNKLLSDQFLELVNNLSS